MQQSNTIFAFLFFAFLFFITARGELRKYMGFLFASPVASANSGNAFLQSTAAVGSVLKAWGTAAP